MANYLDKTGLIEVLTKIKNWTEGKGYQTASDVSSAISNAVSGITSFEYEVVTSLPSTGVKGKIYLKSHSHGTGDAYDEYIWTGSAFEKIGNTDVDLSGYQTKITSSNKLSYSLLSGAPSIPTESTVSGWGFTKNTGTYSKPSGGIPKTDLASAVQTSLGKADTALQTHQDISGKADVNHTHGYITNDGKIDQDGWGWSIANTYRLPIYDPTDGFGVSDVIFDGSTTSKALTPKGTWETFLRSHQSIKTLHNKTLTGSGNVTLSASDVGAVATSSIGVSGGVAAYSHSHSYTNDSALSSTDIAAAFTSAGMTT